MKKKKKTKHRYLVLATVKSKLRRSLIAHILHMWHKCKYLEAFNPTH